MFVSLLPSAPQESKMIGGVFVYNNKGEVLISRVFRDTIT